MKRTKPTGAYVGSEDAFQWTAMQLVRLILRRHGTDERLAMHVPNGGKRNAIVAAKLKRQGVVAGYPDIMVFVGMGLAIELKVWPNKPSEAQQVIHELLRAQGWRVEVCYGTDEVVRITNEYLCAVTNF